MIHTLIDIDDDIDDSREGSGALEGFKRAGNDRKWPAGGAADLR